MGGGNPVESVISPVASVISPVVSPVASVISPVVSPVTSPVMDFVAPVVAPVVALVSPPEPCEGTWSDYGSCSAACDGGTQTRSWTTTKNPKHGGTACPSPTTQSRPCNTQACPVDCVGSWSDYNTCNQPCGGGTQTRTWTTITPSAHGGTACPSPTMELRECNTEPCSTSAGPSAGPSAESTDNNNIIYIAFGTILSVCCCMLVLVLILSMRKKPSSRPRRFRR